MRSSTQPTTILFRELPSHPYFLAEREQLAYPLPFRIDGYLGRFPDSGRGVYNGRMRGSTYTKRDRKRAENLYICSGLTRAKVASITQISAKTLMRWSQADGWNARRATYRTTALTLPERMQALALKIQRWADEKRSKPKPSRRSMPR